MSVPTLTLNNGVDIPAIGFGVYQAAPEETTAAVETALATGYRHVDTAAAYGNEREVGEAVRRSGLDRAEVFLQTKVWISDYGYDATLRAFDKSAGKLGATGSTCWSCTRPCRASSTSPSRPTGRWSGCWPTAGCARSGSATSCPTISPGSLPRPGSCPR
jgi:hypothetical protein